MILNCDSCGRPLGAADVVGATRRCVGCNGPVGPTRAALPDPALVVARAAWTEQVNAHKSLSEKVECRPAERRNRGERGRARPTRRAKMVA